MAGSSARKDFLRQQGFTPAGSWQWDRDRNRIAFHLNSTGDKRVVYAFLVDGAPRYIGICEKDHTILKKRMDRYRSQAGGSTNKRIAAEIEGALKEGNTVEIWALVPKSAPKHKGLPVDLVKGLENPLLARMAVLPGMPLWNATTASPKRTIRELRSVIRRLAADEPISQPGVWYKTQKEHWLGWLKEYDGPGYYNRIPGRDRTAEYAYNHIVEPKMLLYLIHAAGADAGVIAAATHAAKSGKTMMAKSGAIRRVVPWHLLAAHIWNEGGPHPR